MPSVVLGVFSNGLKITFDTKNTLRFRRDEVYSLLFTVKFSCFYHANGFRIDLLFSGLALFCDPVTSRTQTKRLLSPEL